MGVNRGYADSIDRRAVERMYREIQNSGRPDGLTEFEVGLHENPLTTDPQPKKARAWLHFSGKPARVNCYVLAWTEHAVRVRWKAPNGQVEEAWVWKPAVRDEPWVEL